MERELKEDVTSKVRIGGNAGRIECNAVVTLPLFANKEEGKLSLGLHGVNLHRN